MEAHAGRVRKSKNEPLYTEERSVGYTLPPPEQFAKWQTEAEQHLDKALVLASIHKEFWGWAAAMFCFEMRPRWDILTMATDGKHIYYNPSYVCAITPPEVLLSFVHETFHALDDHCMRGRTREFPRIFLREADHTVNLHLKQAGLPVPKWMLADPKYQNEDGTIWAPEEIYRVVPKSQELENQLAQKMAGDGGQGGEGQEGQEGDEEGEGGGEGEQEGEGKEGQPKDGKGKGSGRRRNVIHVLSGGCGMMKPSPDDTDEEREARRREALERAEQALKMRGLEPGIFGQMLEKFRQPKFDVRGVLEPWLKEKVETDWTTWARPDHRLLAVTGAVFPGPLTEPTGRIVLVQDTSGSIGDAELETFFGLLNMILQNLEGLAELLLIQVDAAVQRVDTFTPRDFPIKPGSNKARVAGRGGTSFRPPFEWLKKNWKHAEPPSGLIYLTDLMGDFPEKAPAYPVLWVSTIKESKAPWGLNTYLDVAAAK